MLLQAASTPPDSTSMLTEPAGPASGPVTFLVLNLHSLVVGLAHLSTSHAAGLSHSWGCWRNLHDIAQRWVGMLGSGWPSGAAAWSTGLRQVSTQESFDKIAAQYAAAPVRNRGPGSEMGLLVISSCLAAWPHHAETTFKQQKILLCRCIPSGKQPHPTWPSLPESLDQTGLVTTSCLR